MQKKTRRVKRGNKKTRRQQRRVKRHIYEKGGNDAIDCSKCRWNEKSRSYDDCSISCWQQALSIGPLRNITVEPIKDAATSTGTFLGNTASTIGSTAANVASNVASNTATTIGSTAKHGAYDAYNIAKYGTNAVYETGSNAVRPVTNYFRRTKPTYGGISVKRKRITN